MTEPAVPISRITYVGHATLLIELEGVRLLTDPNWDSHLGWVLRRVSDPGITVKSLPALDAVLLTHAHADHLSFNSLKALSRQVPLYAPPAVARWLHRLGYMHSVAIGPDERVKVGRLQVTAIAAKHLGARYMFDRWRSSANMYFIDTSSISCFFAGDTAITPDTHRIVREYLDEHNRRLDLALLPIGYAPWWKPGFRRGHLTVDDTLELFERLNARLLIPYHWGTFHHVTSGPFDAIQQLRLRLKSYWRRADVIILEPGSTFELPPIASTL